jgi:hypothetical protein
LVYYSNINILISISSFSHSYIKRRGIQWSLLLLRAQDISGSNLGQQIDHLVRVLQWFSESLSPNARILHSKRQEHILQHCFSFAIHTDVL